MFPGDGPPVPYPLASLAPFTTLELGGPARSFVEVTDTDALIDVVARADAAGEPIALLGGGSNVLVPDRGVDGLVVRVATRGMRLEPEDDEHVVLQVAAGEPWDGVVTEAVAAGLSGIECLSGIPGSAGATPIQNVGAYGQEVGDTLVSVRVFDRAVGRTRILPAAALELAYRNSRLRVEVGRFVVLEVTFRLLRAPPRRARYAELARELERRSLPDPTAAELREVVLALRRTKSMVLDADDPNRRSVGSFFTNPIVTATEAAHVVDAAIALGVATHAGDVPRFPVGREHVKLAAGWLIERAGFNKGLRRGPVGISTRHALALVHHGGGTLSALLALADEIRDGVRNAFGVELEREPVLFEAR